MRSADDDATRDADAQTFTILKELKATREEITLRRREVQVGSRTGGEFTLPLTLSSGLDFAVS